MIAREFNGNGWTAEQYDALITRMGLDGQAAPGVVFHWAAVTDAGVHAVDVYDSRELADRLASEQIAPIVGELGLSMPEITEYAVHATLS